MPVNDRLDDAVRAHLTQLREEVCAHRGKRPHDDVARRSVVEAIDAGLEGNAAIGALLLDSSGTVIASEHNRMFVPYFRSDFHAEMVLLTRYEEQHRDANLRGHTLVTSLEPCEMCMIRIINSGVTDVLYVSPDEGKGGVTGPNPLASHWARFAESQNFQKADCDQRLADISLDAFLTTRPWVGERLMARRLPDGSDDGE